MAERKVLNKYYPPDFDPGNMPKVKVRTLSICDHEILYFTRYHILSSWGYHM